MILYFSGTGNSEYAAAKIGEKIQDETINLFEKIRRHDYTDMHSERPWVIAAPAYAWRMPRILQKWLTNTELKGNKDIYFILTCGGNIGNAGKYARKISISKGMNYLGCIPVIMPENYIALFHAPTDEKAQEIISQADYKIEQAAELIKNKEAYPQPRITIMDKLSSGIVNNIFYPLFVRTRKFYASDTCISCGKCVKVCPLENICLEKGRPAWGKNCTHCMSCICRCPVEAIEYGQHSKGQVRYTCPKDI